MVKTTHEPNPTCMSLGIHCWWHQRDEPATRPYLICGECFHTYRTRAHLWAAHQWGLKDLGWKGVWRNIRRSLVTPPSRVWFCPHCTHNL
jgi:hypothetical protein